MVFPLPTLQQTTGRNDTMQVWMVVEFLCPCMQNADDPNSSLKPWPWILGKCRQGLPHAGKQQIVECLLIHFKPTPELFGHSEGKVIVRHIKKIMSPLPNPALPIHPLTRGAMSIATTIVMNLQCTTVSTCLPMTSQSRCSTSLQGLEYSNLIGIEQSLLNKWIKVLV